MSSCDTSMEDAAKFLVDSWNGAVPASAAAPAWKSLRLDYEVHAPIGIFLNRSPSALTPFSHSRRRTIQRSK